MINVSGKWLYSEEFDYGTDTGYAEFTQTGNQITGVIEYTENIDGEKPFRVRQEVRGEVNGSEIEIEGISVSFPDGDVDGEYNLDSWNGVVTAEGKIVGYSVDSEDINGVFVLWRE